MIRFRTESGSIYTLDDKAQKWERPPNPNSPFVRTQEGKMLWHSTVEIGRSVCIVGPPLDNPLANVRAIYTTAVVEILE